MLTTKKKKERKILLTSGSVAASVTQAEIHVTKYMASFVIFLVCVLRGLDNKKLHTYTCELR